jgi:hypothetical protein
MMPRAILLIGCLFAVVPAMAQNLQPTTQVPPDSTTTPPEKTAPSSGSLSQRLSQQQGTLHPRNVDPRMTVGPSPNGGGATPVIPPPGGNQSVVPK